MRIALYLADGLEQIVLTPETSTETMILARLADHEKEIYARRGGFYETSDGVMQPEPNTATSSVIIVTRPAGKPIKAAAE